MRILPLVAATAILFSASPAFAAENNGPMPGEECQQVGATRMSQDEKHILACLRSNDPNRPLVWKSSTGGGVGITGGCVVQRSYPMMDPTGLTVFPWGKGCEGEPGQSAYRAEGPRVDAGYACGQIGEIDSGIGVSGGSDKSFYLCVNK